MSDGLTTETIQSDGSLAFQSGNLKFQTYFYHESILPLERFFKSFFSGEFSDAFSNIDFSYSSSNIDNEALEKLVEKGFVPALVNVTNTGSEKIRLSNLKMELIGSHNVVSPRILNEDLPSAFNEFNGKALAANIWNGTVVVTAFVAVMAVAVGGGGSFTGMGGTGGSRRSVMNSLRKKSNIAYEDLLFPQVDLKPGEDGFGLVFFKPEPKVESWSNVSLRVNEL